MHESNFSAVVVEFQGGLLKFDCDDVSFEAALRLEPEAMPLSPPRSTPKNVSTKKAWPTLLGSTSWPVGTHSILQYGPQHAHSELVVRSCKTRR